LEFTATAGIKTTENVIPAGHSLTTATGKANLRKPKTLKDKLRGTL